MSRWGRVLFGLIAAMTCLVIAVEAEYFFNLVDAAKLVPDAPPAFAEHDMCPYFGNTATVVPEGIAMILYRPVGHDRDALIVLRHSSLPTTPGVTDEYPM
jgi:hypothetical protein